MIFRTHLHLIQFPDRRARHPQPLGFFGYFISSLILTPVIGCCLLPRQESVPSGVLSVSRGISPINFSGQNGGCRWNQTQAEGALHRALFARRLKELLAGDPVD